jgi:glycosyltransferase involved in cell wall biosynthesis
MRIDSGMTICWVLINIVPYHDARASALAARLPMRVSILEMTNIDEFQPFERETNEGVSYRSETLFPGTPWGRVDQGQLDSVLWARLDALKPAVVCLNGWSRGGCATALRWCLANRVPTIVFSDSAAIDMPRVPWREFVKRRYLGLCSAALVAGTPHADYLLDLGFPMDRIFSGYDVVDNRHFETGADLARLQGSAMRQRLGLPERFFLASARFVQKKNLAGLLHAYAGYRAKTSDDPWSLVVLGDGELKPELVRLRSELGLDDAVSFPGFQLYQRLPAYYGLASCFVHASTTEQWGLVVNEAMAAGLPVLISQRCGCAADLVQTGGNGFVFDPMRPDDLTALMLRVSARGFDLVSMGRRSRAIISNWSTEAFSEGLESAIACALGTPRPKAAALDRAFLYMMRGR